VGRVLHSLPEGESVWGVTSLDNLLYVLRDVKASEQIESTTLTLTAYSDVSLLQGLGV